nr:hypothetical protein [Tanacetum cinerariifolium]
MPIPEDITDPTTAMNMALVLMAKAFKLNYSTPTNNNQRISSNPRTRQIAQPSMNMGKDIQMQMVGGNGGYPFRQYAGQNVRNQNGYNTVQNVKNQNLNGNGNVVAARADGNVIGNNGNQIRCYNCRGLEFQLQAKEFDLMAAVADLDEIEEVNANCILMANLQQASTSSTQTDKAPVYDSDGSAERISSNPRTRQIAQPSMNMGKDIQMQMVGGNGGNPFRQYAGQNVRNQNGYNAVQNVKNQNPNGNGNVVAARADGNAIGNNGNQIRCYNCRGLADLDEIEEANANCILMANLQQVSTSSTQTDKAPVYDSDGSAENDNNAISEVYSVEQGGGTVDQHPVTFGKTRTYFESLYNNLAIEVENVNSVNRRMKETNADLTT